MQFVRFLISRFITFVLVVWIGITIVFFVPRIVPSNDPVSGMLAAITSRSSYLTPHQVEIMRQQLLENFGLTGTIWQQYFDFLKRVLFTHDFGPSIAMYPMSVNQLIANALPWTLGLLLTSLLIAWLVGNLVGLVVGYRGKRVSSKIFESLAMLFYPIPYPILGLVFIILFTYIWPIFPIATSIQGSGWTWSFIGSVLYSSLLPALSLIVVGFGWWVLSMKALSSSIAEEDFVTYARLKGLREGRIMGQYVMRNAILPQVTALALAIGGVFGGAMFTEIIFNYPGLGTLLYGAITGNDYNLMMGTVSLSVFAVAAAAFVVDLIYPLLDPRIRLK
jgi:peptide/nickel transport system permease protein